ncbi:hypothetical protein N7476_010013 [Penicillium atrosanguineum]|uniref:Fungal N-terminal domain-containing protein n=1 Tax=Penicillium atrosanguineum TaxID=1132637 RepID=A0A9W9PRA2_9EURO|nr:hypothetical protein N7476_010013 [Penicillium atrosanguineum]
MTQPTYTSTFTAQSVKEAQSSVIALLDIIKAAEYTTEAVKELSHRLSSIDKALGGLALALDETSSCKLSHEVRRHLHMVIRTNQDACVRCQEAFSEWKSPLINESLHESSWHPFGAFVDIQSQLLSKRLHLLEDTINMVMQINAMLPAIFTSNKTPTKNDSRQAQRLEERAAERIACEIGAKGIAMHYHRKIFDELLAEFGRLRWGQMANTGNEGQLPNATGALSDEIQWSYDNGIISMNGIAVARFSGSYNDSDALSIPMVHADNVPETAD